MRREFRASRCNQGSRDILDSRFLASPPNILRGCLDSRIHTLQPSPDKS